MRASRRTFALLALPALAHAVTLSDFSPRADQSSLSSSCEAVYTANIPGCLPKDFQSPPCSTACVNGMANIAQQVQSSCPNHQGDDVIAAFLAGGGPQRLCPNANQVLGGAGTAQSSSSQQQPTNAQSSQAPSSTPSSASPSTVASSTESTSSASSVASSASLASSPTSASETPTSTSSETAVANSPAPTTSSASPTTSSTSSTGMLVDTSAAPSASGTATSTGSSNSAESTGTQDHSGGGSPFDTQGNLQSGASTKSSSTLALVLAAAFAVLYLHQ